MQQLACCWQPGWAGALGPDAAEMSRRAAGHSLPPLRAACLNSSPTSRTWGPCCWARPASEPRAVSRAPVCAPELWGRQDNSAPLSACSSPAIILSGRSRDAMQSPAPASCPCLDRLALCWPVQQQRRRRRQLQQHHYPHGMGTHLPALLSQHGRVQVLCNARQAGDQPRAPASLSRRAPWLAACLGLGQGGRQAGQPGPKQLWRAPVGSPGQQPAQHGRPLGWSLHRAAAQPLQGRLHLGSRRAASGRTPVPLPAEVQCWRARHSPVLPSHLVRVCTSRPRRSPSTGTRLPTLARLAGSRARSSSCASRRACSCSSWHACHVRAARSSIAAWPASRSTSLHAWSLRLWEPGQARQGRLDGPPAKVGSAKVLREPVPQLLHIAAKALRRQRPERPASLALQAGERQWQGTPGG